MALLYPIFAEFVANVEHDKPTKEDHALLLELREVMLEPWEDEVKQSQKFRLILGKHYNIQLYSTTVAETNRISNGPAIVGELYMWSLR